MQKTREKNNWDPTTAKIYRVVRFPVILAYNLAIKDAKP